jgi:hypothetical protein
VAWGVVVPPTGGTSINREGLVSAAGAFHLYPAVLPPGSVRECSSTGGRRSPRSLGGPRITVATTTAAPSDRARGWPPGTALKVRSGSHPPSTAAPGSPESRPLRRRRAPSARSHFRAGPPGADRPRRNPKVPTGLRREKNSSLCNGTGSWPPGLLGLLLRPSKAFTSGRIALQGQPGNSPCNYPGGVVARFHLPPSPTSGRGRRPPFRRGLYTPRASNCTRP